MPFFNNSKKETRTISDLKTVLDNLLLLIESIKGDYDLDKIFEIIGSEFKKVGASVIISVMDNQKENLIIRYVSVYDGVVWIPKVKRIPLDKIDVYPLVFEKKVSIFCKRNISLLKSNFPELNDIKYFYKLNEINSIIVPLILKNEILGFVEILSTTINQADLDAVHWFSRKLTDSIAHVILFQEIKKSEERYRDLFENSKEGFFILNERKRRFIEVNKGLCGITGYTADELLNMNYLVLFDETEREKIRKFGMKRLRGFFGTADSPNLYDTKIRTKKGEIRFVEMNIARIMNQEEWFCILNDVTEKKVAEKDLKERDSLFKLRFEKSGDGNMYMDDDILFDCNEAGLKMFGFKNKEDIFGMRHSDISSERQSDGISSDIKQKGLIKQALKEGGVRFEWIYKKADRTEFPAEVVLTVIPQSNKKILHLAIRDITERKLAEEESQKLSEFNKRIFDNAPVSIIVLDKKGIIVSVNKLAMALMRKTYDQAINRKLIETNTIKKKTDLKKAYESLLQKGGLLYYEKLPYIAKDSKAKKYLNIIAVPLLDKRGKIDGAISMAINNTESVLAKKKLERMNLNLEKKIRERTKELDKTNKVLATALELKSQFIADASHELRTPLTVIQGNLDLAEREISGKNVEVPDNFGIINQEVDHMINILSDLTLLTNSDSDQLNLNFEKVNLARLIETTSRSLRIMADQKNIKITHEKIKPDLQIFGDETQLEKLLINIVRNAIKYGKDNGWVKIGVEENGDKIIIKIEDNGIGISKSDLPYIFERFYRSDHARAMSEGGSGLGLAICKWIAEAHGGMINVESLLGKGSKFTISLNTNPTEKNEEKTSLF